ncbi:hypothetical protein RFI_30143 [Reticulomyxa filosa]|uniref:Uncharacterized protein n=1 Tax=Reticulomyxa filosa TaxID=46433 RepID=X6M040_RETFI|nr:hypothetical protein RFI_30143 [Reticulomyxa filosa]|eukprot:ETO07249.1 hypothetical protein RFI_30143 [Reticulomyxa filosa]
MLSLVKCFDDRVITSFCSFIALFFFKKKKKEFSDPSPFPEKISMFFFFLKKRDVWDILRVGFDKFFAGIFELIIADVIVILLDEVMQCGYGMGSGISLLSRRTFATRLFKFVAKCYQFNGNRGRLCYRDLLPSYMYGEIINCCENKFVKLSKLSSLIVWLMTLKSLKCI